MWGAITHRRLRRRSQDHDRRLTVVGVFDARPGKVQDDDDRLVATRALFGQDAVEAFAVGAQGAERVADRGRPVHAGDDAAFVGTVWAPAERRLDHVRHAVRLANGSPVFERLQIGAGRLEPGGEMILADEAEVLRLHRPSSGASWRRAAWRSGIVDAIAVAEELRQRHARRADLLEHEPLLRTAGKSTKLADELPHGARVAAAILVAGDVGTHQSPQTRRRRTSAATSDGCGRHFSQAGSDGLEVDAALAVPSDGQRKMWVEPAEVLGHL